MGMLLFTTLLAPAAAAAAAWPGSAGAGTDLLPGLGAVADLLLGLGAAEEDEAREASAAGLVELLLEARGASVLERAALGGDSASFLTEEELRRTAGFAAVAGAAGLVPAGAGEAGFAAAGLLAGEAGLRPAFMLSALVGELAAALGLSVTAAAGLAAGSLAALVGESLVAAAGLAAVDAFPLAELVRVGFSPSCFAAAGACIITGR